MSASAQLLACLVLLPQLVKITLLYITMNTVQPGTLYCIFPVGDTGTDGFPALCVFAGRVDLLHSTK